MQINYGYIENTLTKQSVQFSCTPHASSLRPLVVLPSGGRLVMVDLMTGRELKRLHGHYGSISCVAGHPIEQVRGWGLYRGAGSLWRRCGWSWWTS